MNIIYTKKSKRFKYSLISNVCITCILIALVFATFVGNYNYSSLYENTEVIYNGNKSSNKVSLMINVYWGNEYIEGILDVLKNYSIKTTFFVGGSWSEKYPELMSKIVADGHEIGNHGYFHEDHSTLTYEQNYEEISATHNLIKVIYDVEINLFAPPSGSFNNATIKAATELGYRTIMWSKDTIDWRDQDVNLIIKRATQNISGGDLVLMHPTSCTLKALPAILEYYKANNILVDTVSNCLI